MIRKFVTWEASPKTIEEARNTPLGRLHDDVANGDFSKLESKESASWFNELWHRESYESGIVKSGGWLYDFGEFFKTYVVKDKWHGWHEIKAPNKTWIRKNAAHESYILKIIEL